MNKLAVNVVQGTYLTIAPDLFEHTDRFTEYLRADGFGVRIEPNDVAFPQSPTLMGKRGTRIHFVEVNDRCQIERLKEWVAFAKTRQQETFVSLVVPLGTNIRADALSGLRALGVGLFYSSDAEIQEILIGKDLSLPLSLPEISKQRTAVRRVLRPVYVKFERGEWFDGFKDACQVVEDFARKRFVSDLIAGRISLVTSAGNSRNLTVERAKRLTLGQLAVAHAQIVAPNQDDTVIRKALEAINPDRVGAVHKTNDSRTRSRLRKNVSRHMWTVIAALKVLI